jgi:hypothetical protein
MVFGLFDYDYTLIVFAIAQVWLLGTHENKCDATWCP